MAFMFMTSYAPSEDSALVGRFHADLKARLATITSGAVERAQLGYRFDPTEVDARRVTAVEQAAAVPAMLVLYSDAYFADVECGREWTIFSTRRDNHSNGGHQRLPAMIELVWTPPSHVPPALSSSQMWSRSSSGSAVRQLAQRGGPEYRQLVELVADEIDQARRTPPDPLDPDLVTLVEPKFPNGYDVVKVSSNPPGQLAWTAVSQSRGTSPPNPPRVPVPAPSSGQASPVGTGRPVATKYAFFLSHATRPNDRRLLGEFCTALEAEVERRVPPGSPYRGFLAPRDITGGEDWRYRLLDAVRTTPVMIGLLGGAFFASGWCGWEWAIFTRRGERASRLDPNRPTSVLPVPWLPCDVAGQRTPAAVKAAQWLDLADHATVHNERRHCLVDFMREDDRGYPSFLIKTAFRIADAVQQPPATMSRSEACVVNPSFGEFPSDDDGPHLIRPQP